MNEFELGLVQEVETLFARILDNNGDKITPRTAIKQALIRLEIPLQAS